MQIPRWVCRLRARIKRLTRNLFFALTVQHSDQGHPSTCKCAACDWQDRTGL